MDLTEKEIKDLLFEIYSAGFEKGYAGEVDLVTCFEEYYSELKKLIEKG